MLSIEKLEVKEKKQRRTFKDMGIKLKDPLSPEFIKDQYDTAFEWDQGMNKTANKAESQIDGHANVEAKNSLARDARRYRKDGKLVLDSTVDDIRKYVKKNNGYYHEQAMVDMAADPTTDAHAESMARTLDEIKGLKETETLEE